MRLWLKWSQEILNKNSYDLGGVIYVGVFIKVGIVVR